jgi:hypothetical protein
VDRRASGHHHLPARGGVRAGEAPGWSTSGGSVRMAEGERAIGSAETASRVLVSLFALYLALVDGPPLADGFGWGLH